MPMFARDVAGYLVRAEPGTTPTVAEVRALRAAAGWDDDTEQRWQACLGTALVVATARTTDGTLVGMGVLTGSPRHAVFCDLVVHPEHRRRGLAGALVEARLATAAQLGCRYAYVGLSDENPHEPLYTAGGIDAPAFSGELTSWPQV